MLRRLYFVLPNTTALSCIVDELEQAGIDNQHLAVAAHHPEKLQQLGLRVQSDVHDKGALIERLLWTSNLALFFIATLVAVAMTFKDGFTLWLLIPTTVMLLSFTAGLRFTRVPNMHVPDFADTLRHGELLLMVDIHRDRVAEIEDLVHRRHPEATVGGVGWASDLLHV